jgi:hypothetical protein
MSDTACEVQKSEERDLPQADFAVTSQLQVGIGDWKDAFMEFWTGFDEFHDPFRDVCHNDAGCRDG